MVKFRLLSMRLALQHACALLDVVCVLAMNVTGEAEIPGVSWAASIVQSANPKAQCETLPHKTRWMTSEE